MASQAQVDAGFFALVHNILNASDERDAEARRALRESFDGPHIIALYHIGHTPGPDDLHQVRCQDLSFEGISYFDTRPPTHERLLLRLGSNPIVCLIDEVEHHTEVIGRDGPEFLVCCKFVGRMPLD